MLRYAQACGLLLALVSVLPFSDTAQAAPITYTFTGESGSGSLDGTSFTDRSFTITAHADTLAVLDFGGPLSNNSISASINIDGLGTFSFVSPTQTFFNDGLDLPGFSRGEPPFLDLYSGPASATLNGWDMTTAIGPVSGSAQLLQWNAFAILTSGGILRFDDGTTAGSFAASLAAAAVPVPGAFLLFGSGLGALALTARRRKQTAA
jgi:hypothetical protein